MCEIFVIWPDIMTQSSHKVAKISSPTNSEGCHVFPVASRDRKDAEELLTWVLFASS